MIENTRFDDALPDFVAAVARAWGADALRRNFFLRDGSGKLTFIILDEFASKDRGDLAPAILKLGAYTDGVSYAVLTPEDMFDDSLRLDNLPLQRITVSRESFRGVVKLLDRRVIGSDWLRIPSTDAQGAKRLVFASLKGGVGRSTSLCVVASEFAKRGKRVIALDMDLEAPGLGSFILKQETLPDFGLLDYLVENEVGQVTDESFFVDMIGASWLGGGLGRVDVIPALGQKSVANPANVLAKIARAYLGENLAEATVTFGDRMQSLLNSLSESGRYDLILIDARAGLHETTAAAVLGVGADVLLFGLDQTQTYQGFELLFSHVATLPESVGLWLDRLTVVHGRASANARSRKRFVDNVQDLISKYFPEANADRVSSSPADLTETFQVDWAEPSIDPVSYIDKNRNVDIVVVDDDERFRDFDPISNPELLATASYEGIYKALIELVDSTMANVGGSLE